MKAVSEIHWWISNIDISCHNINNIPNPDITIHTDASLTSWGITDEIFQIQVLCHKAELEHINVLKLKKKSDSSTETLRESTTTSKIAVNDNHGNATTVKILEASLKIVSATFLLVCF